MKKFALCLMVLVLLLTAFGCAGGYGTPDEFAPSGEFTEEPGDTPEESQENLPAAGQMARMRARAACSKTQAMATMAMVQANRSAVSSRSFAW